MVHSTTEVNEIAHHYKQDEAVGEDAEANHYEDQRSDRLRDAYNCGSVGFFLWEVVVDVDAALNPGVVNLGVCECEQLVLHSHCIL